MATGNINFSVAISVFNFLMLLLFLQRLDGVEHSSPTASNPLSAKKPCMMMLLRIYFYSNTESNVKLTVPRNYHGTQFNNLVEELIAFKHDQKQKPHLALLLGIFKKWTWVFTSLAISKYTGRCFLSVAYCCVLWKVFPSALENFTSSQSRLSWAILWWQTLNFKTKGLISYE